MISSVPPAFILIIGALLIPLFNGRAKKLFMLLLPLVSFVNMIHIPDGVSMTAAFMGLDIGLAQVDKLSLLFGYIFHLILLITVIYSLHLDDDIQHVASIAYAGAALGAVFAADFFSLFLFWETLTITATLLVWARRTRSARASGMRYLLVHGVGGLLLLAGILLRYHATGSIAFTPEALADLSGFNHISSYLIFIGFGVNCAWPLLHNWLTDAYPEGTITGTIALSAFTTKTAVYVLARGFMGTEILVVIGAVMAGFPIFYAVIENDLRRVLAYSLINQVGFMVVGVGIGTAMALNGAVAHAFNDILFKGLLFMSMGAVMYRTGKINATDLGGLYKKMPLTCIFCIVGAASISAFPFFSGFVSKSMIMDAAAHEYSLGIEYMEIIWFILLFASAGVFHHAGIKIPFFAFFGHDAGHDVKEAPLNMLLAMGIAAFLCIFIGSYPQYLYDLLPYDMATPYKPYTVEHVASQTQILFFSALAFTLLLRAGIYPPERRAVNVDSDVWYRKGFPLAYRVFAWFFNGLNSLADRFIAGDLTSRFNSLFVNGPQRVLGMGLSVYNIVTGTGEAQARERRARLDAALEKSAMPVSASAAVASVVVLALILFTILD